MADDIAIVIKVEDSGVLRAVKNTKTLQSNVKTLSDTFKGGSLSQRQYYKGISELATATGKSEAELRKYAAEIRKVQKAETEAKAATKANTDEIKRYRQARREATEENRRYDTEARKALQTSKQQAAVLKQEAKANQELRMRYREGHAAMVTYRAEHMRVTSAQRKGIITIEEEKEAIQRLNTAMASGTGAFANLGTAAQIGGRRVNSSGMLIQQAGYQFGDFAVQVQGGTNPMVAFGQQATQMIGAFNMLPQAILASTVGIGALRISVVALIASLGVIVPVLTAFGAYFMRARAAAKEAESGLSDLEGGLKSLDKTLSDWVQTKKAASMGITVEELLGIGGIDAAVKSVQDARDKLKDLQERMGGDSLLGKFNKMVAGGAALEAAGIQEIEDAIKGVEDAEKRLADLRVKQSEERIANFEEENTKLQEQLLMAVTVADFGAKSSRVANLALEQRIASYNRSIDQQVESLELEVAHAQALKDSFEQVARLEAAEEAITRSMEHRQAMLEAEKALLEERNSVVKSIVEGRDAEVKRLSNEIALNQTILDFGKESAQVAALKAEQAREAFIAEKMSEGQLGNNLRVLIDIYDENVKVTNELEASEAKALGLADALREAAAAMASLSSFGAGLDKALAVSIAKVQALKTGADAAVASSVAAMRFDSKAKTEAAISAAASSGDPIAVITARAEGAIQQATIDQIEANQLAASGIKESNKSGRKKKGGKSSAQEAAEAIKKLREQLTLQEALLGKTEAQRQVIQALGVDYKKTYGAKATDAIIARIEALKAEEEQIANIQSVADTMKSSMSDAFMSMVEGTKSFKDAMKDMARAVIKQLFDILVVQQLVGSFDAQTKQGTGLAGALMGGLSGLFDGGGSSTNVVSGSMGSSLRPPVKSFSGGGYTGDGSRSGGLDGEGGYLAMLHPKETVVDHTKGQSLKGGGDVYNINQSFNFSANGDESVKKIIAQAAPQIAKMTQQGLMDQRRRGGVVKSTFS